MKEGKTTPPKHFMEDTILQSMETASAGEMPKDAERKGIGTPATRAAILEKLVATGLVERKKAKKITSLLPTQAGSSLVTVLPEVLQSPLLTVAGRSRARGAVPGGFHGRHVTCRLRTSCGQRLCRPDGVGTKYLDTALCPGNVRRQDR